MLLRSSLMSSVFSPLRSGAEGGGALSEPESSESNVPGQTDSSAPAAEAAPETPAEEAPPAAPVRDWRDREIARKHAQIMEAKDRTAALQRENEELRAIAERVQRQTPAPEGDAAAPAPAPRAAPVDNTAAVRQEAERLVAEQSYDRDCNATFVAGQKAYGKDWNDAIENVKLLGGLDQAVMVGLLATDDPAKVLYTLGNNPDEYHRILALPPAKRMNEMVKLAATAPVKKKAVSGAPAPVEEIGGRAAQGNDNLDDGLDDDTWFRNRAKQKKEKFLAERREQGMLRGS